MTNKILTYRYALALVVLGLLSTASMLTMVIMIHDQTTNAAVMNQTGRQRSVSQRIAKLSVELIVTRPATRTSVRRKLKDASSALRVIHGRLMDDGPLNGTPLTVSASTKRLYYRPRTRVHDKLVQLAEAGRRLSVTRPPVTAENKDIKKVLALVSSLRVPLNEIVDHLQEESEADVLFLKKTSAGVWLVTVVALVLVAAFVFRPAARLIDNERRALEAANAKLAALSALDGLTGISNRRRLNEFLDQEWRRTKREGAPLSLIMADIDFFKDFNDAHGHRAGDICLQRVAGAINDLLKRPGDIVARYGGEEFVVVLPNTDTAGAAELAEIIRRAVEVLDIEYGESKIGNVTLSLGIASRAAAEFENAETLVNAADMALYAAKQAGRNRICVFDPETEQAVAFSQPFGA